MCHNITAVSEKLRLQLKQVYKKILNSSKNRYRPSALIL